MASKGTTAGKQKRNRPKARQTSSSISEESSEGSREESKKSKKQGSGGKKQVRSKSEEKSPADYMEAKHCRHQSMDETGRIKSRSSLGSELTSRHKEASDGPSLDQEIRRSGQSSTSSVSNLQVHNTTDDEGINMASPKSSINSAYSDHSSEFKIKRMPTSHSKSSSISSAYPDILEDWGEEEENLEESDGYEDANAVNILQKNDSPVNTQENDPSNASTFVAPNLHLKEDCVDPNAETTSMLKFLNSHADSEKQPQVPVIFPAQHSATSNSNISPFDSMEPQQETPEAAGHYVRNFVQSCSSNITEDEKKRLHSYNSIMREATVAMIRDSFDKVQHECDKMVDNYRTRYEALEKEHRRLKEQHKMEKQYLSQQIQEEREKQAMESSDTCNLAAELEKYKEEVQKLQSDTQEFQQIKDDMKSLRALLAEKQTELEKLRMTIEKRSGKLRNIVPPLRADQEQMNQIKQSEECLTFLMRLKPDKKTIEEEIRRYEYRIQQRPYAK